MAGAEPTVSLGWKGAFAAPQRSLDLTTMTSFLSLRKFEQERRRVEILQGKMQEKQRLRRESALYRARQAERDRLVEKQKAEARLLIEAQQARARIAREEEAARARKKQQAEDNNGETPLPKLDFEAQ